MWVQSSPNPWNVLPIRSSKGVLITHNKPFFNYTSVCGVRVGCHGNQPHNGRLGPFGPTPRPPGSSEGLEGDSVAKADDVCHQSYPCAEASTKTQRTGFKSFWVGKHVKVEGGWGAHREWGSSPPLPHPLPRATPSIRLFLAYIIV